MVSRALVALVALAVLVSGCDAILGIDSHPLADGGPLDGTVGTGSGSSGSGSSSDSGQSSSGGGTAAARRAPWARPRSVRAAFSDGGHRGTVGPLVGRLDMKLQIVVVDLELPPAVKRWGIRIAVPVALLVAGGAVARAAGDAGVTSLDHVVRRSDPQGCRPQRELRRARDADQR